MYAETLDRMITVLSGAGMLVGVASLVYFLLEGVGWLP